MSTCLAVLQPGYLPWLGFFDQLRRADVFVIYDDVQYDKHGWRNRNRIKGPAGPHWLTVPVRTSGRHLCPIVEMEIDGRLPWARKHLGTIGQFYRSAPFFGSYYPELAVVLEKEWPLLIDLDLALTRLLARWLDIRTPVCRSSELGLAESDPNGRLLQLCRHFKAGRYLSGAAARNYLDAGLFASSGIEVIWQDYQHPVYEQLHGPFVPYLSMLDLLFNCGERSRRIF
jgi:hypothetical protein